MLGEMTDELSGKGITNFISKESPISSQQDLNHIVSNTAITNKNQQLRVSHSTMKTTTS